ncbi:8-oxo-dGTP pyrophosphatase MutT (NUDIX family) [Spinactinospora alkalitolerans]|uniref:8-oxo-dGTP pyrophosphatase MutT (NUDIX family) n=1 Tax=Spinactinospora alkalitolerans TaxID=687207 RepID=A0A852U4R0_9ACTN|nr:NUDIX hydrolase [Spinactinospora alkalitolerans]NYE50492.1 8-oxo-dGTP pyrophosphatase MutT (NUDIX family) [Spinactinospora alkalitolerans]
MTVGGGVEPEDNGVEAALHREVFEELGGKVGGVQQVRIVTDRLDEGIGVQHFFLARLLSMDIGARTGCVLLGSVHEHGPGPWAAVSAHDYGRWWFEASTTRQLTGMLLAGHAHRAHALPAGSVGPLDRGSAWPAGWIGRACP